MRNMKRSYLSDGLFRFMALLPNARDEARRAERVRYGTEAGFRRHLQHAGSSRACSSLGWQGAARSNEEPLTLGPSPRSLTPRRSEAMAAGQARGEGNTFSYVLPRVADVRRTREECGRPDPGLLSRSSLRDF